MRLLRPLVAAAASGVGLLASSPSAWAAVPTMPLSDVQPGMVCTVSSVIQGEVPTTFDATVIGVYGGPAPAEALIIMRFSGAAIASTGIGQGFSGSPVTCPDGGGTPRVIGAISAGIGEYDNFVGGVTPIEAMLATPTWGEGATTSPLGEAAGAAAPARRKATTSTTGGWIAGRPTMQLSGPRGALAERIAKGATRAGIPLRVGPTATRKATSGGTLAPGDAVAASIATGDAAIGAVGTVTYVDGDRVWAFGHPFNGTGAARLLMQRASITTVIGSPSIGNQVTYKLGQPTSTVGTVGFDGAAAIGGVLGGAPSMIEVRAGVHRPGVPEESTATTQVVDERAVRGGSTGAVLPMAVAANTGLAVQRLTKSYAVGGATRTCTTIRLKGGQRPLTDCTDAIVATPDPGLGGVETGAAAAAAGAVTLATSAERFVNLIERVDVDITHRAEADSAAIVRVALPRTVKAGRTVDARVTVVQGSTGERRILKVPVKIPRAAARRPTGILVTAAPIESPSFDSEVSDELLLALGGAEMGFLGAAPKDLTALRGQFTSAGLSGIRSIAMPGLSGGQLRAVLEGGDSETPRAEMLALRRSSRLARQFPALDLSGGAVITVRPTR